MTQIRSSSQQCLRIAYMQLQHIHSLSICWHINFCIVFTRTDAEFPIMISILLHAALILTFPLFHWVKYCLFAIVFGRFVCFARTHITYRIFSQFMCEMQTFLEKKRNLNIDYYVTDFHRCYHNICVHSSEFFYNFSILKIKIYSF